MATLEKATQVLQQLIKVLRAIFAALLTLLGQAPAKTKLEDFELSAASQSEGQVHVLLMTLDYKKTRNPLTCSLDGKNMEKLLAACKIPSGNITIMRDEECTRKAVEAAIRKVGNSCKPGDCLVFFYAGHGVNLPDENGDEEDGMDEAFCFVTPDGQITKESCMTDDVFSKVFTESVDKSVRCLVLADCCHSATVCDFNNSEEWKGRTAISITGCRDSQTSGDTGKGGIFTHAMLQAIGEFDKDGIKNYSVGKLYGEILRKDDKIYKSVQDIMMQCAPGITPSQVRWPLIPRELYTPPAGQK